MKFGVGRRTVKSEVEYKLRWRKCIIQYSKIVWSYGSQIWSTI